MLRHQAIGIGALLSITALACAAEDDDFLDPEDESFVGSKADGFCVEEDSPAALGILALVNDSAVSFDELDRPTSEGGAGLNRLAAANIVDERPFASLADLDSVKFVGNSACSKLNTHACEVRGLCEAEAQNDLIIGVFEEVFIGEVDPFVVGEICILYVREVGFGPIDSGPLVGITEDFSACGITQVANGAVGLGAIFDTGGLQEIAPGAVLEELTSFRDASYFAFDNAEVEFALDACDPTWSDLISECSAASASSVGGLAEGFQHCTDQKGLSSLFDTVCDPSFTEPQPASCTGTADSFLATEALACKAALAMQFQ